MQIEKTLINDRLREKYPESLAFQLFITLQYFTLKFAIFLQSSLLFSSFYCLVCL